MTVQLAQANSIRIPLADESVHCCITSPPFFGLRDYGLPPMVWGGDPDCEHRWGDILPPRPGRGNKPDDYSTSSLTNPDRQDELPRANNTGQFCQHCGCWRGSLGLEPDVSLYVAHLVEVFREVKRVLRADGVVWLNLGASYAGGKKGISNHGQGKSTIGYRADGSYSLGRNGSPYLNELSEQHQKGFSVDYGDYKPKDLIPVPWLVALALQRDGWWLRSAPPWLKKNCLPESVRDRPTTAHEYWFLLSKSARYFYDAEAVRFPLLRSTLERGYTAAYMDGKEVGKSAAAPQDVRAKENWRANPYVPSGRNRRTTDTFFESLDALIADQRRYLRYLERVRDNGGMLLDEDGDPLALVFNTKGYAGAHYATFNPDMIEPLVKCSTSERGVCPRCGAGWERVTEKGSLVNRTHDHQTDLGSTQGSKYDGRQEGSGWTVNSEFRAGWSYENKTTGWRPTCDCAETYVCEQCNGSGDDGHSGHCLVCDGKGEVLLPPDPAPAVILDPFVGSGTVPMVARKLGRHGVGLDLSFDYLRDQARVRLELDAWHDWHDGGRQAQAAWEELPLFAAQEAV